LFGFFKRGNKSKQVETHGFTKRQLSSWQQAKKRQLYILAGSVAVVVAVLGLTGAGVYTQWYLPEYKPLHEAAIQVNDTTYDMDYYVKILRIVSKQQSQQQSSSNYLNDMFSQTETAITQGQLIKEAAAKMGITVSEEELDTEMQKLGANVTEDHRELVRTTLLTTKLAEQYSTPKVATIANQIHLQAMFLEDKATADKVMTWLKEGDDFNKLAGKLSMDDTTKRRNGELDWHPQDVLNIMLGSPALSSAAFSADIGLVTEPLYDANKTKALGYWVLKIIERRTTSTDTITATDTAPGTSEVRVYGILLGNQPDAEAVRARLNAGEDFATVAKEVSLDPNTKDNGGDFGWLGVNNIKTNYTFGEKFNPDDLETGVVSAPLADILEYTPGGYWIYKVIEKEDNREVAFADVTLLGNTILQEWLNGLEKDTNNKVTILLTEEMRQWAAARIRADVSAS
jgi:parvulin-like peptidyl-prolyl isomerase